MTTSRHTMTTIVDVLERAAADHPGREAVVDGDRRITYAELERRADEVAGGLLGTGLEIGDRVGIWGHSSLDWIIAAFGVYLAGGVLVPISTRYKSQEAEHLLRKAKVRVLLAEDRFLGQSFVDQRAEMAPLPHLEHEFALHGGETRHRSTRAEFLAFGEQVGPDDRANRRGAVRPANGSEILFTSGTTGEPKGVLLTHDASVRTYAAWTDAVGLQAGDRHLVTYPLFHTAGLKSGVLASVLVGATIHVLPMFDAERVLEIVEHERITVLPGAPTVFQMLLDHPRRIDHDLSSIRCSVTGAAVVPTEVIRAMRVDLGIDTVITGYGLTETCGTVSMCDHEDSVDVVARTVGRPLPGIEVRVVDGEGDDVPSGEPGEVVVRGFNVMSEYFEDPDATSAAFFPEGWLRTGDIGRFDEAGRLEITDRLKDMIIVGGFNVYPAEVENMLLERDDVSQVAVVGAQDERLGEVPIAFVVPAGSSVPDSIELHSWARGRMANYKVPRHFELVTDLPLTPTGKVLKPALRARVRATENQSGDRGANE